MDFKTEVCSEYVLTKCTSCGKKVPYGQYCINCGHTIVPVYKTIEKVHCSICGGETAKGNYCSRCGNAQNRKCI